MTTGISSHRIADTPVAVIDFETTGRTPGYDRVVEDSIVRIDPGSKPTVVFDTLVNPSRAIAATKIHCVTDCVIQAYNVYFDINFLNLELSNAGVTHDPLHFCLM